jgi:hypothetical protein
MPYLPDFRLPGLECWLEIKGDEPTAEERVKALMLAEGTGYPVFVFVGLPAVSDLAKPTGFGAGATMGRGVGVTTVRPLWVGCAFGGQAGTVPGMLRGDYVRGNAATPGRSQRCSGRKVRV